MMVTVWIAATAILLSPFALVALVVVPRCRRWWLRPLQRRRAARRARIVAMEQARRDARTAILEAQLDGLDTGRSETNT